MVSLTLGLLAVGLVVCTRGLVYILLAWENQVGGQLARAPMPWGERGTLSFLSAVDLGILGDVAGKARGMDNSSKRSSPPRVSTNCGDVEGFWERGVAAFRGIPYGAPPIGVRRWKPAEPAPCWAPSVLQATHDGSACYQGGWLGESEDCLNLNVFVPARQVRHRGPSSSKQLPVLVWIFGGANVWGSVRSYGSIENLVRSKHVVLVAMNYRLNIFGYLALEELSAVDPRGVSGNYGILDQQLALQWVRKNIHNFGGDADKVTMIGQSSGGSNVLAHLASASSRGLFHRAISLSGSPNLTMDRATKEAQDRRLVLGSMPCGRAVDVLSCLYSTSTHDLWKALPRSYTLFSALYDYPVDHRGLGARESALLFVDGVTVTHALEHALHEGLNDVPVLLQSLQAEMDCYPQKSVEELTWSTLQTFFARMFSNAFGPAMPLEVLRIYSRYKDPRYAVYAVDADTAASCGLRQLALAAQVGYKSPVYWSVVTGSPSRPFSSIGKWSSHFPFHNWDFLAASRTWFAYIPTPEDVRFGEMLLEQWSGLAEFGQLPNNSWRPVQDAGLGHVYGSQVRKETTVPVHDMKDEECTFWASVGVGRNWWWIN